MAQEEEKRAWWFYLIGCTPLTGSLLLVLAALVLAPLLFSLLTSGFGKPTPKRHKLPEAAESRSWILMEGRWRWIEDVDADGQADCFRRAATVIHSYSAPEHEGACLHGVLGTLARLAGSRVLEDPLRGKLSAVHTFKFERRWTLVTTLDVDGDGAVDCVAEHRGNGLVLRRGVADCPFAAHSFPEPLESHDRLQEFQQLFELEDVARRALREVH